MTKVQKKNANISEEEFSEYKETFNLYDKNGGGYITTKHLGQMHRSLGQNPTESELQDMIVEFDLDGDGKLDLFEFCEMMNNWKTITNSEEELLMAFRVLDKSNYGYIVCEDLQEVLHNLGENFTNEYIDEIFREGDQDCDGVISYEEFLSLMK